MQKLGFRNPWRVTWQSQVLSRFWMKSKICLGRTKEMVVSKDGWSFRRIFKARKKESCSCSYCVYVWSYWNPARVGYWICWRSRKGRTQVWTESQFCILNFVGTTFELLRSTTTRLSARAWPTESSTIWTLKFHEENLSTRNSASAVPNAPILPAKKWETFSTSASECSMLQNELWHLESSIIEMLKDYLAENDK